MEQAHSYAKKIALEVAKKFSVNSVTYSYHELSEIHILDIFPRSVLKEDAFLEYWSDVISHFIKNYEPEAIIFATSSHTPCDNVLFQWKKEAPTKSRRLGHAFAKRA